MKGPMLRRVERQAAGLSQMLARVGIKEAAIIRHDGGATYALARATCISCSHSEACHRWLDREVDAASPPEFCANAELFERVRAR